MISKFQTAKRVYRDRGTVPLLKAASGDTLRQVIGSARYEFLQTELQSDRTPDIGLRNTLRLLSHGFYSRAGVLYDFESYEPSEYLTHYERRKTQRINGDAANTVIDKYRFHEALSGFDEHRPEVFGIIEAGEFSPDPESPPTAIALERLDELLESADRLVLKPRGSAGGGRGVAIVERDGGYRVNGDAYDRDAFEEWVAALEDYIVTEYVEQGEYANGLFPDAANTMRVVTMIDEEGPFVAAAAQRIGTTDSAPVDNWSAGGLSASIEPDGTLSAATGFPADGNLVWYDRHPDTDAQLSGTSVPGWENTREKLLEMADSIPGITYIGWDALPTDDGFKIIEGNAHVDVNSLQVHEPLLADQRVRAFYKSYGVLS